MCLEPATLFALFKHAAEAAVAVAFAPCLSAALLAGTEEWPVAPEPRNACQAVTRLRCCHGIPRYTTVLA